MIQKYAPNTSFIDIGRMWRVNGEYAFEAIRAAAYPVTGLDGHDATGDFDRTAGDAYRGYAPWFWLPTPSCLRSMVEAVGFEVKAFFMHRRATTLVATPSRAPVLPPL